MSYTKTQIDAGIECERCGKPWTFGDWLDTAMLGDPERTFTPGYGTGCPDPKCGKVCRICRRDIGDVHTGECAEIVLGKLTDQAYVTREDCT